MTDILRIDDLLESDRFTCKKPRITIEDPQEENILPLEVPIEHADIGEKSRLVESFNRNHQKPGFKVSR